jgi:hypothetical protein
VLSAALLLLEVLDDKHYMALWPEDFSKRSMEEMVRSVIENRAWSKELRLSTGALVNSRLAKQIGEDEYATTRGLTNESVAECKRREIILMDEIRVREAARSESHTILNMPSRAIDELQATELGDLLLSSSDEPAATSSDLEGVNSCRSK